MIPVTLGRNFFPGIKVPLSISDDFDIPLNSEECFKIIFAEKGNGIIEVNGKKQPFITPVLFCINDRTDFNIVKSGSLSAKFIYFQLPIISDALTREMVYDPDDNPPGSYINDLWIIRQIFSSDEVKHINPGLSAANRIALLIDQLDRQLNLQDDNFWPCRARSFFLELIILIERVACQTSSILDEYTSNSDLEEISPVILYMNNFYYNKISINDLARSFSTNRTTLTEKFVKATGMPPIKYLIKLRIRIASKLLQDTTVPINEIIERVGFEDMTHFGRMFKKYTGVSPSAYRDKFVVPKYILA